MSTGVSRYQQVFSVLRQRIEDGHHRVGEKLPPEDVLASEWQVSRATMRMALAQLEAVGLVTRQQGRGTFVAAPVRTLQGPILEGSLDALITATQLDGTTGIRIAHASPLPVPVARRLGLDEPSGTVVTRLRVDDGGAPYGWLVNYLPDELAEGMTADELATTTLLRVLEHRGVRVASAEQSIRARVADVDVAEALAIDVGAPVLAVERLVFDTGGRPVELLHSTYRSDRYQYRVNFGR